MGNGRQPYNTSDSKYPDLIGRMTMTGNNIATYHSNNLGDANLPINNRPAPPPVSAVLTFSNGQKYTICGHPSGPNSFSGKAYLGEVDCPMSGLLGNGDDDWTATKEQPEEKLETKPRRKPAGKKKPAKKTASKKATKKPASKKAAKKSASKRAVKKTASEKAAGKKAAKKPASRKR